MLAGLLIAMHDADDRPGALTATLPFGGATLIEYQARLLVGAGASQLVVLVARLTPELIGAINRIGRRGVTVDTVRSAGEAADKLHPLARVMMMADGLTTNAATVAAMVREGGDALLVLPEGEAQGAYERLGGGLLWAGMARLDAARLRELAAMPRDYDVQSTLVRLASQARATHVMLPADALREGHGIEHGGTTLDRRGRGVLAAMVAARAGWFDRAIVAPIARLAIPRLVARSVPSVATGGLAVLLGAVALALVWIDHAEAGLVLLLSACVMLALAAIMAELRDEVGLRRGLMWGEAILPVAAVLLYGHRETLMAGDNGPRMTSAALVLIALLARLAQGSSPPSPWWGSVPGYTLVLLAGTALSMPLVGLVIATLYGALTATAAIERLRQQP